LFLDRKSLHVILNQLGERKRSLLFTSHLLFHSLILSQFPDNRQKYLPVRHSVAIFDGAGAPKRAPAVT